MANELKFGNKVVFLGGHPINLAVAASDPVSGSNGEMYYNSTLNVVRVYQAGSWQSLATGSGGVSAGVAGNLSLYPSNGSSVDDVYQQNGQDINVAIESQGSRSAALTYTIPNPGDAVTAASFVLTEGNQTINGNKTLSGTTNLSGLTASRPLKLDASKNVVSSAIDLANGVDVTGVLPVANGGTNSSTSLNNNRVMQSSGGAIVEAAAITASRALISDANGIPTHSSVTSTELGYVSGVTSAIQTQLNSKANDADVIKKNGSVAFTADQSMGGFKLTNVANPTDANDAANKGYVDSVVQGLKPKAAVRVASTANVSIANGLENGDTVDGVTLATGDRVLLKNQSAPEENGIYVVVASGAASRSTDFDSLTPIDEINGAYVPVEEGTENAGKIFIQSGAQITTIGTDPINFVYFNSISNLVGGDGITLSGANISVDHDGEGFQFSGGQLSLELDGATLSKSASGLKVADGGISNTQINASAGIDATKIAAGNVDNTEFGYLNGVTSGIQGQLDGKASTALSNLASTAVNADINPSADNVRNLGSSSLRYAEVHAEAIRSGRMGDNRASFTFSGDTTNGSAVIAVASTAGFKLFDDVSGAGIPQDSYIVSIVTNTSITINQNATATATGVTLTYKYNTMLLTAQRSGSASSGGVGIQSGVTDSGRSGPVWMFSGDSTNGDSGHVYVGPGLAPNGTQGQLFLWGSVVNLNTFGGEISANSARVQDVGDPTQLQDAVTLNYADTNYAKVDLSNLASTAVNADINPGSNDSIDLGTAALNYSNIHAKNLISSTGLLLEATSGNLDIKSTKVRRSESGSSTNYMEDQYFDNLSLAANTSSATEISSSLSFALASFDSAIIEYKIKEATSNKVRVGQFIVTTDGTIASSSDQYSESATLGSALGLSLSADISGGNVRILFNNTHATNAATMRCNIRRIRA